MFLGYFDLREQPFGETPDTRFLYLSPTHREALASLYYGIESQRGFLALIAEPGIMNIAQSESVMPVRSWYGRSLQ